jgi:hypothetical protein
MGKRTPTGSLARNQFDDIFIDGHIIFTHIAGEFAP